VVSGFGDQLPSETGPVSDVSLDDLADDGSGEGTAITLVVGDSADRLDRWLADQLPEHSRSEVQRWIAAGRVTANGRPLKASYHVASGQEIAVSIPPTEDYAVEAEPIPLDVIYEDGDLLVVDKPAGMVVHPAAGNWHGTLVNAVLYHCPDLEGVGGAHRPGIVHRLDRDTSGLILVAKNDRAPYRSVLTHGFVVDAKGQKMSKSKRQCRRAAEGLQ